MFDWYVNWKKNEQRKELTKKAVKDQVIPTKKLVIDILNSLAGSFSGATGREVDKIIREKMGTLVKFEE